MNTYSKVKSRPTRQIQDDKKQKGYRLSVLSRVVAAAVGGYVLALVASIVLAAFMPGNRADGVLWAMQLSFAVYTLAVIWVFAARTATRAWIGLFIPIVFLSIWAVWLTQGGVK